VKEIGAVPEHWDVKPIAQIGRLLKGTGGSKEDIADEGVPCVRYGDLYTTHSFIIRQARTRVPRHIAGNYTSLRYGDVLFACSGETFEEIGKSAVNLIAGEAICGGDLAILRPSSPTVPAFLGFAADSVPSIQQKASMGRGTTVKHIYPDELRHLMIALPPMVEQETISAFLERETANIDALVAEQRRLIELLKEKRQVVTSNAVTKGLDPAVPMMTSGDEWLGDVPSHWSIQSLRSIATVVRGASPRPAGSPEYFHGDFLPWVTVAEITKDTSVHLSATETCLTEKGAAFSRVIPSGTLIYSNSGATLGVPKILDIEACANDGVVAFLNLVPQLRTEFLYWYLDSITAAIREKVKQGSGQPNLNTAIVGDIRLALPPLAEQDAILECVGHMSGLFASLEAHSARAIELFQERRTALISAAVTGQIDVCGLAPSEAA
jgi:type I restriction enzyme S subunit